MTIAFYEHPFSSYVQKAKTALYEKGILFESKMIDGSEPVASEFAALWPIQRFSVIVDDGQFVFEATGSGPGAVAALGRTLASPVAPRTGFAQRPTG
jgi:hypothetical protein